MKFEELTKTAIKINAKPGQVIVPVKAESCEECVFHTGVSCGVNSSDRTCSEFESQFGGYVFKVVTAGQLTVDLLNSGLLYA
jgi:hypothetical protein